MAKRHAEELEAERFKFMREQADYLNDCKGFESELSTL